MSPRCPTYTSDRTSFPRVSGDEPYPWETLPMSPKFSPRERG